MLSACGYTERKTFLWKWIYVPLQPNIFLCRATVDSTIYQFLTFIAYTVINIHSLCSLNLCQPFLTTCTCRYMYMYMHNSYPLKCSGLCCVVFSPFGYISKRILWFQFLSAVCMALKRRLACNFSPPIIAFEFHHIFLLSLTSVLVCVRVRIIVPNTHMQ